MKGDAVNQATDGRCCGVKFLNVVGEWWVGERKCRIGKMFCSQEEVTQKLLHRGDEVVFADLILLVGEIERTGSAKDQRTVLAQWAGM